MSDSDKVRRGGFLITRVSRAMGRIFEALMRDEGLSDIGSGEGRLVYLLWTNGPLRQGELAAKAGIDKSTLALTLARMERKDLVQRTKDGKDARGVMVSLGAEAAAHGAAYARVSEKMGALFYRDIPDADITHFEAILEQVLANLEG